MVGFAKAFDQTEMAQRTRGSLAQPYEAPNPKCEEALIQYNYALNGEKRSMTLLQFEHAGLVYPAVLLYVVSLALVLPCMCWYQVCFLYSHSGLP